MSTEPTDGVAIEVVHFLAVFTVVSGGVLVVAGQVRGDLTVTLVGVGVVLAGFGIVLSGVGRSSDGGRLP